jgi:hypothetical protein
MSTSKSSVISGDSGIGTSEDGTPVGSAVESEVATRSDYLKMAPVEQGFGLEEVLRSVEVEEPEPRWEGVGTGDLAGLK